MMPVPAATPHSLNSIRSGYSRSWKGMKRHARISPTVPRKREVTPLGPVAFAVSVAGGILTLVAGGAAL